MKIRNAIVSATAAASLFLLAGQAVQAQADKMEMRGADRGWYISGLVGLNKANDSDIDGAGIAAEAEFDWGPAALVGIGFDYSSNWRAEVEAGYRDGDVDSISGTASSGDSDALSLIANVFYDINIDSVFEPYVGAGLGLARVSADGFSPVSTTSIDDDDYGYALQAAAGVAYPLNERLKLTVDYRFLSVQDLDYTTASGVGVEADYNDHAIFVGLRFALNPPRKPAPKPAPVAQAQPAPPAPAPAPTPPPVTRNFLVFFDWDSSALTPQALAILRQASDAAKTLDGVRVVATGHADRSGPASYNVGLSQRRADAVRGELVRLGIAGGEIATLAKGETDPLVATPDGVREPQNRRVSIILN
ncbi:MAG: outer membrane beta-barrel protein [Alphaproteobacteria bacterium]